MIFLSLVALTVAVAALAAVRFTSHGHGRHAAETLRTWPPFVRGQHARASTTEPPEIVLRFGEQPEAVA